MPANDTSGYLSLRKDFRLNPSMSASALQTAINSAIVSAISAGRGIDLGPDVWPINGPLTIAGALSLRASGVAEVWGSYLYSGIGTIPGASPWVQGGGLIQQASGADILQITGTGTGVNIKDMLLSFGGSSAFLNTGHAINATPSAAAGTGLEQGMGNFKWSNIVAFGHDGNHYGYYTVNAFYFTVDHIRSYGGGGWFEGTNTQYGFYGNGTLIEPYFLVMCGGSADGFHINSPAVPITNVGRVNVVTMIRPQANFVNGAGTLLGETFGVTVDPSTAQYAYQDVGRTFNNLLIAPDFEPSG